MRHYAALVALLTLGGCSEANDAIWPPTVEQIEADLGRPPRGEMRLRNYHFNSVRGEGKAYWYYDSCKINVYFEDIKDDQNLFYQGSVISGSPHDKCYSEDEIISVGGSSVVVNGLAGDALSRKLYKSGDSILRGFVAGEVMGHFLPYAKIAYSFEAVRVSPP